MRTTNIVVESIAYQSNELADALVPLCEALVQSKTTTPREIQRMPEVTAINKLVQKHTGINPNILFDTEIPPLCSTQIVNPNHQLLAPWQRELANTDQTYDSILKKAETFKESGTINLKTGKVSGLFSEIGVTVYMGWAHCQSLKLSGAEIAAVIMHEVGHAFTYCEYIARSVTTNQVLAAVHHSLMENGTSDEHKIVLQRAGDVMGDKDAFQDLVQVKDKQVITTVIIKKGLLSQRSEVGTDQYDQTSAEQLADQYASRYGLGRDLVVAMDKCAKAYSDFEVTRTTRAAGYVLQAIVWFYGGLFMVLALFTGMVWLGAFMGMIAFLCLTAAGATNADYTYDNMRVRYKRIREDLIGFLKNHKAPAAQVRQVMEDIEKIDGIVAGLVEYKTLFGTISNFIFPSNRALVKAIDLQRRLEELASNDLFLRAQQISLVK